jgi:hypothetical protein
MAGRKNSLKKKRKNVSHSNILTKLKKSSTANRIKTLKNCPLSVIHTLSKAARHKNCKKYIKQKKDKNDFALLGSNHLPLSRKKELLINNTQYGGNLLTGILGFLPKLIGGLFGLS